MEIDKTSPKYYPLEILVNFNGLEIKLNLLWNS